MNRNAFSASDDGRDIFFFVNFNAVQVAESADEKPGKMDCVSLVVQRPHDPVEHSVGFEIEPSAFGLQFFQVHMFEPGEFVLPGVEQVVPESFLGIPTDETGVLVAVAKSYGSVDEALVFRGGRRDVCHGKTHQDDQQKKARHGVPFQSGCTHGTRPSKRRKLPR